MFLKKELKLILISSIFLLIFFFLSITAIPSVNFDQSVIRILNPEFKNPIYNIKLERIGKHWGTGFFVKFEDDLYVVTARHVVDNNYDLIGIARLLNITTNEIEIFEISLPKNNWIFHPENGSNNISSVDVAVTKINQLANYEITAFVYDNDFSSKSYIDELIDENYGQQKKVFLCKAFNWFTDFNIEELFKYDPTRPILTFIIAKKEDKILQQKYLKNKIVCRSSNKLFEDEVLFLEGNMYPGNSGSPVIDLTPFENPKNKLFGIHIASEETRIENNFIFLEKIVIEPAYRIFETLKYSEDKFDKSKEIEVWRPLSIKLFKNI
jgi:hypothetical protein